MRFSPAFSVLLAVFILRIGVLFRRFVPPVILPAIRLAVPSAILPVVLLFAYLRGLLFTLVLLLLPPGLLFRAFLFFPALFSTGSELFGVVFQNQISLLLGQLFVHDVSVQFRF